jgi:dihydroorotate dehydrogenase
MTFNFDELDMKQALNTLKRIEHDAIELGNTIRNEGKVFREELEERQRLGLQGDAAIKHYNEWMQRNGMEYLMVK